MISFACPSCGRKCKAPDGAAGKNAKCPACGRRVEVPHAQTSMAQSTSATDVSATVGASAANSAYTQIPGPKCELPVARKVPSDDTRQARSVLTATPDGVRNIDKAARLETAPSQPAFNRKRAFLVVVVVLLLVGGVLFFLKGIWEPGNNNANTNPKMPGSPRQAVAEDQANIFSGHDFSLAQAVLGEQQSTYKVHGFKDIMLGDDYAIVQGIMPFKQVRDTPRFHWLKKDGKEDSVFVFDTNKKLISHSKSYSGGPSFYEDQLVQLFGRSKQPVTKGINRNPLNASQATTWTQFTYHFETTLVRVRFNKTVIPVQGENRSMTNEKTFVDVTDRQWVLELLADYAKKRRGQLEWAAAFLRVLDHWDEKVENLPPLAGTTIKRNQKSNERFQYLDDKIIAANDVAERREQQNAVVVGITPLNLRVGFNFNSYSPDRVVALFKQDKIIGHPLGYTPLGDLVDEVNVLLLQQYLPPKPDQGFGPASREWITDNGWKISTRGSVVSAEKIQKKAL